MFHPTCPYCKARKTVKCGLPRWRCQKCSRTFRITREDRRDRAAIDGYVKDRSTYSRLATRWKVDVSTAYRRVRRALERRTPLLTRTKRLLPKCDGILVLDGKHIRIAGDRYTIFVAWDRGLGLPVHFILAEGGERELWYWKLLLDLRDVGYAPKGFVSDGIAAIAELAKETYEKLPHQRCTVHVFLRARAMLMRRGKMTAKEKERHFDMVEEIKWILWAATVGCARRALTDAMSRKGLLPSERRALRFIAESLDACFVAVDSKWKHLNLPRSSNAIENVIGQIEARLKTRRGTKSFASLNMLVNELLLEVREQVINR